MKFEIRQLEIAWMSSAYFKVKQYYCSLWVFKRLGVFFFVSQLEVCESVSLSQMVKSVSLSVGEKLKTKYVFSRTPQFVKEELKPVYRPVIQLWGIKSKSCLLCGTIASRHLVGRWFRDYHMCRLVFLCFFPRPRCFQIRGKRRWLRSSRWRLEFVLERWKSCQANLKNDENKAFVINSNKRLFTQLFR